MFRTGSSFKEPAWIHDRDEPFLQRRDRLPEPAEEAPRLGMRDFVGTDLSMVCCPCRATLLAHGSKSPAAGAFALP